MAHQVIWPKVQGNLKGNLPTITQGSTLETLTIAAFYSDGTAVDLTGKTITATAEDEDGNVYDISGVLTGANASFTWALSNGDIGTDGIYTLIFTYTDGVKSWASDPVRFVVRPNPAADTVQNEALVGIGTDDAAWVAAGSAGGALGDAAYEDTTAFDAAGAAAAAQAAAIQRANHTGTQLLATISDVTATGSSLAQAASVDAARGVLGMAAVALPPRVVEHQRLSYSAADVVGSGALSGVGAGGYFDLTTGATANSTYRHRASENAFMLNYSTEFVSWDRKIEFYGYLRVVTANAQGVYRLFLGKPSTGAFGLSDTAHFVALEVQNGNLVSGHVCSGGAITTIALTSTALPVPFYIFSENGTVNFYANGVLIGTTASGPTLINQAGGISHEINNGATAAAYRVRAWSMSNGY